MYRHRSDLVHEGALVAAPKTRNDLEGSTLSPELYGLYRLLEENLRDVLSKAVLDVEFGARFASPEAMQAAYPI